MELSTAGKLYRTNSFCHKFSACMEVSLLWQVFIPTLWFCCKSWRFILKTMRSATQQPGFTARWNCGWGDSGNSVRLYFSGLQISWRWWLQPWNEKTILGSKVVTDLDSILKSRDITLPTKFCLVKAMVFFQWSCMDVRVGLWRKLSAKKSMLLNCGVGEDSWESLGLQGDPTSPS